MQADYVQCYIEGMKTAGYHISDNIKNIFILNFSECKKNEKYRAKFAEKSEDFLKFCAAYAQLKTNKYLGCSNNAPYDIKSFLHLSKNEFDFFVEIIPPELAGFAKGSCNCQ